MKDVWLFACIEKNIGDDLFVYTISKRYPDIQFTITSDADYGSLSELKNLVFSDDLKRWIWASSIGENSIAKRMVGYVLQKVFEFKIKKKDIAVYIVGNAFKNLNYVGKFQTRWIKERLKLADEFYLLSTNFGPFNDNRWVLDCSGVFSEMADVCFRDKDSFAYFKNIKCVRYAPDAVFCLGKKKNKAKKMLLISVIDFSFDIRGDELRKKTMLYEEKMVDIANGYISDGYEVIFLNSNKNQDQIASERIIQKIMIKKNIRVINYDGDLTVVFDLYKNAGSIIATRLHTIVLAFLYGIPVIPIEYDIKVTNLLKMCRFKGCSISLDDLEILNYDFVKRVLLEYTFVLSDEIIEKANEQFECLDKKLKI